MRLLLINACGLLGIVALADEHTVLRTETLPGRGTSEHLMPAIRRLLGDLPVARLAAIGVVIGPGSFTGVRVGLSAAKGLCEAGAVPIIALSRLELVALAGRGDRRVALLDAGRGEYYCGVYAGGLRVSEQLLRGDEVLSLLSPAEALTCEARVAEALDADGRQRVRVVDEPDGAVMACAVRRRLAAGEVSDVATVDANYLRRTDAELKRIGAPGPGASGHSARGAG